MKTLLQFIRFYAIAALFIAAVAFGISLFLYVFRRAGEMPVADMLSLSLFNAALNGIILGFVATAFVTFLYYYNTAKTNRHNKKVLAKKDKS